MEHTHAHILQLQADLTLTPAFNLGDTTMSELADYLSEVVGYFVVETIVSSGTQSSYLKSALVSGRMETGSPYRRPAALALKMCVGIGLMLRWTISGTLRPAA